MKLSEIDTTLWETASMGATSAGAVATVSSSVTRKPIKRKQPKTSKKQPIQYGKGIYDI